MQSQRAWGATRLEQVDQRPEIWQENEKETNSRYVTVQEVEEQNVGSDASASNPPEEKLWEWFDGEDGGRACDGTWVQIGCRPDLKTFQGRAQRG